MKFTLATIASLATVVSAHQNLRKSPEMDLSACNKVTNQASCFKTVDEESGLPCAWCVAGAIPSECVTQEQAKQLPESVFECSVPGEMVYSFMADRSHTFYSKENDICDASSKSISGYMDIKGSEYDKNGQNKHLFYWMFEKRGGDADENTPFIIWLTGGPGCSSTLALLTENGPCSVNPDGESTSVNPYSWTEAAHVLWLDQPAGVGFSYGTEDDANEKMVGEDAYYFLQAFFQTYPQYAKSPLYIVGESYGGHYAPAIAHRVWIGNNHLKPNTIKLNLSGLGIGNGLTDPEEQYKWYPEMGHNNSHGIKVFDDSEYESMKQAVPACTKLIHQCNKGDSTIDNFACQTAFITCNTALTSPYQATGLNPYDIRIKCAKPPLCYDFENVKKFLNLPSTKQALGVDMKHSHAWNSCNFAINMKFHTDWMKTFAPYVADLLNAGIPALIYAGDVDFICNYLGNKAWTLNLEWNSKEAFNAAEEHEWQGAGLARTADGFTFLQVYDAGHMVPSDQPKVALDMIRNFVTGGEF